MAMFVFLPWRRVVVMVMIVFLPWRRVVVMVMFVFLPWRRVVMMVMFVFLRRRAAPRERRAGLGRGGSAPPGGDERRIREVLVAEVDHEPHARRAVHAGRVRHVAVQEQDVADLEVGGDGPAKAAHDVG